MNNFSSISEYIYNQSGQKAIFIFSIAFVFTLLLMMYKPFGLEVVYSIAPGTKILDTQFNYSSLTAHETLNKLGASGRQAYIKLLIVDYFYILAYTGFYIVVLTALAKYFFPRVRIFQFLWVLPLSGAIFDAIENIFTLIQINAFPNDSLSAYGISNLVTMVKMIIMFPCEVIAFIGAIAYLVSFLVKKLRPSAKSY